MIRKSYFLKILIVVLSVSILFSLSACNKKESYKDVPQAYVEILQKYDMATSEMDPFSFEEKYNNGEFDITVENSDIGYTWRYMLADLDNYPSDSFGYILKDINGDSVEELFLVGGDHTVLAIFTIIDNNPFLLDAFWSRYKGFILDTNEIYVLISDGAQYFEYTIKKLNDSGDSFETRISFGYDRGNYYKIIDNQNSEISQTEFKELLKSHPLKNGAKWNETEFTSIR